MAKIIRTPTKAHGGITDAEKLRMDEHASAWISNAMRTNTCDRPKLTAAIKELYRVSGLKEPRVVIVPSPLVMAMAGGFAAAIWWLRKNATDAATDAATHAATDAATLAATRAATAAATDAATDAATRAATDAATRAATDAATGAATLAATHAATGAATDAATHAATYAATLAATLAATAAATLAATLVATLAATRAATAAATDAATDTATDAATDTATAAATRAATDTATDAATDTATDAATADATAAERFVQLAREILGEHAIFGLKCAQNWYSMYQGGNMWSAYDCYLTACRDILGLKLAEYEKYARWEQAALNGGFRIMHDEFCMVSDFPCRLKVDEENRPHSADGPSHEWRDGWRLYHWHGVRLDNPQIIEAPETLIVAQIEAETNSEVRRVMIDRYGPKRYLTDSGATVVQEMPADHPIVGLRTARLLRKEVLGDETIVMIDLLNSTPEPDGSVKRYLLRVDPQSYGGEASSDCLAAVASTWRNEDGSLAFKRPQDYAPQFES
jgi:hypothetical protein